MMVYGDENRISSYGNRGTEEPILLDEASFIRCDHFVTGSLVDRVVFVVSLDSLDSVTS